MAAPLDRPRCLNDDSAFPHKSQILAALEDGASIRRSEKIVSAERHLGTYQIRLRIAHSPVIKGYEAQREVSSRDIEYFLSQLSQDPAAPTRAWFVKQGNERYTLIENDTSGKALGCLYGEVGIDIESKVSSNSRFLSDVFQKLLRTFRRVAKPER